jgi:SET domain-containing protein
MLLVKTKLGLSTIEGVGLFADQDIEKGQLIWVFNAVVDTLIDPDELAWVSPVSAELLRKYTYMDTELNRLVLCGDDARFFNHSDTPNCDEHGVGFKGTTIANQYIPKGTELTCDYKRIHTGDMGF